MYIRLSLVICRAVVLVYTEVLYLHVLSRCHEQGTDP